MKKRLSIIIAIALMITLIIGCDKKGDATPTGIENKSAGKNNVAVDTVFKDVSENEWFYGNVQYVYDNGIMNGTATDKFEPNSPLSRAMGVTILYRAAGKPHVDASAKNPFDDVKSNQWYTDAVLWAYDSGIVNGREETKFVPGSDIKRQEFAAILARYAETADLTLPENRSGDPADVNEISDYAVDAVKMLYRAEIILGRNGNIFDPEANITRAEVATMIERFMNSAEEKKPEVTDSSMTGSEEPNPTVTEPEETNLPVIDPEEFVTVLFDGTSYTYYGNTPQHFEEIADGKVKTIFWGSGDLRTILEENEIDIVVVQATSTLFQITDGFYWLRNQVGNDKAYYSFHSHVGPSADGSGKLAYVGDRFRGITKEKLEWYRQALEERGEHFVALGGIVPYNPEFREEDFFYFDTEIHPKQIMGYCIALAMYCEIFNVKAADQNNGILSPDDIPGNTQAEKDAYMVKVKETVQYILDLQ